MQKQSEKNVWETINGTYSLSVGVQTTINHISICFIPQYQRQRKCLVNSQTGFCRRFLFPQFYKASGKPKIFKLAHYFPYDVKLRLLAHSRSFLANQKARNAIVGAEN